MIKMKALKPFGVQNANEGRVSRGREFTAANEHRAKELEAEGLAYRIQPKMQPALINKMEPVPSNKAADTGPLDLLGGETGAEAPAPSSHQGRRPRARRSTSSEDESQS